MLWRYLTVLHDQRRVVDWIQNTETSGAPRWPDLTPELVNDSTACSSYMRENILDLLARYKHRGLSWFVTAPLRAAMRSPASKRPNTLTLTTET